MDFRHVSTSYRRITGVEFLFYIKLRHAIKFPLYVHYSEMIFLILSPIRSTISHWILCVYTPLHLNLNVEVVITFRKICIIACDKIYCTTVLLSFTEYNCSSWEFDSQSSVSLRQLLLPLSNNNWICYLVWREITIFSNMHSHYTYVWLNKIKLGSVDKYTAFPELLAKVYGWYIRIGFYVIQNDDLKLKVYAEIRATWQFPASLCAFPAGTSVLQGPSIVANRVSRGPLARDPFLLTWFPACYDFWLRFKSERNFCPIFFSFSFVHLLFFSGVLISSSRHYSNRGSLWVPRWLLTAGERFVWALPNYSFSIFYEKHLFMTVRNKYFLFSSRGIMSSIAVTGFPACFFSASPVKSTTRVNNPWTRRIQFVLKKFWLCPAFLLLQAPHTWLTAIVFGAREKCPPHPGNPG